jgi:hypothetical protein
MATPWVSNRLLITDSVDVIGHGSSTLVIDDQLTWLQQGLEGLVENPPGYTPCDATPPGGVLKYSDLIFQIGDQRVADNSGIEVQLQGFTVTRAGGLLLGAGGPYIKLVDVVVRDTASATPIDQCTDSQIYMQGELEIVDSAVFANTPPEGWGPIRVGGEPLRIVNSSIRSNFRDEVISGGQSDAKPPRCSSKAAKSR